MEKLAKKAAKALAKAQANAIANDSSSGHADGQAVPTPGSSANKWNKVSAVAGKLVQAVQQQISSADAPAAYSHQHSGPAAPMYYNSADPSTPAPDISAPVYGYGPHPTQQHNPLPSSYHQPVVQPVAPVQPSHPTFNPQDPMVSPTPGPWPGPGFQGAPQQVGPYSQEQKLKPPIGNALHLMHTAPMPAAPSGPTLIPREILEQMSTRIHCAQVGLGDRVVSETRKGLSRLINLADRHDIEAFGQQLRNHDASACLEQGERAPQWAFQPVFALSYQQANPPVGRFKFTEEQWFNLLSAADAIAKSGITYAHLWLDQCLWLRDASQESWAHTGLMPYVIYPVISLGSKPIGKQRTTCSYVRMWPFVEEVAALWSMGLIITRELRDRGMNASSSRRSHSFNLRTRLEPEESFRLILQNIFHGATDSLATGWADDVKELKEMARWNFMCKTKQIVVGSDWRMRLANVACLSQAGVISEHLLLSKECVFETSANTYLDQTCMLRNSSGWDGLREWRSGNDCDGAHDIMDEWFYHSMAKCNVLTNLGEFQLLCTGTSRLNSDVASSILWLLVAMDGRSANFVRGRVAWTKILHGEMTCSLGQALAESKNHVIASVLEENLGTNVQIVSIADHSKIETVQWV